MTEQQIATLFFEVLSVANASMMSYVTIVFAVIGSSYFIAHKLPKRMLALIMILFSMISVGYIMEITNEYGDIVRLGMLINELSTREGSSLHWHGASFKEGRFALSIMQPLMSFIVISTYAGTIWFVFLARRLNKNSK